MTVFQDDRNKFHHSGTILLLASSFLIVPLASKLKLLLGLKARCSSKGNMLSLQEQHITQSEIVKLIYIYCIEKLFTKLPTVQGNMFLVCSFDLIRTAFICSLDLKSLNENVQYHYEMDQYSAIS